MDSPSIHENTNRTVAVIGASGGLGTSVVRALLDRGDRVIAISRNEEGTAKLQAALPSYEFDCLHANVGDKTSVDAAVRAVAARTNVVDALIILAAVQHNPSKPVFEIDEAEWIDSFRINTIGPVHVCRAFLDLLSRSPDPTILIAVDPRGSLGLTSVSYSEIGRDVGRGTAYAASKAALNMVALHLHRALLGRNVKVQLAGLPQMRTNLGDQLAAYSADQVADHVLHMLDDPLPTREINKGIIAIREGEVKRLPW